MFEILPLLKSLISVKSLSSDNQELKKIISITLSELRDFNVEKFEKNNIPSALVYPGKNRPNRFKVILNAHLDVVAAKDNQFKPHEENGKLYGRGAIDMKAAAAVEILVFKKIVETCHGMSLSIGFPLTKIKEFRIN